MKRACKLIGAVAAAMVLTAVIGCGEQPQVIVYQQGKYQGKADTRPADNDPGGSLHTTSQWSKGDKASWEVAIKARNQNQNEYARAN